MDCINWARLSPINTVQYLQTDNKVASTWTDTLLWPTQSSTCTYNKYHIKLFISTTILTKSLFGTPIVGATSHAPSIIPCTSVPILFSRPSSTCVRKTFSLYVMPLQIHVRAKFEHFYLSICTRVTSVNFDTNHRKICKYREISI